MSKSEKNAPLSLVSKKRRTAPATLGFGVPDNSYPHHFIVQVPRGNKLDDLIHVVEDFGTEADPGQSARVTRARITRRVWARVRQQLQHYLNLRLRARGVKTAKFAAGDNQIDRLLGRELCLLFWALEGAGEDIATIDLVYHNWLAYSPEEMWWMFQQVAKGSGASDSPIRGWRQAVRQILATPVSVADQEAAAPRRKKPEEAVRPPLPAELLTPDFFDDHPDSGTSR